MRETGGAQRPLKEFFYSSTPGRSLGKLQWADRYNYVTISGSPNTGRLRESYAYEARGGRVSERTTELFINGNPTPSDRWAQGFESTPLGEVDLLIYPYCVSGGCMDAKFSRDVEFLYARGWLSRVRSSSGLNWADVSYHANGMVSEIEHRNGVTVTHGLDPNWMQRPRWIETSGVSGEANWSTGDYSFDGTGNVVEAGESRYLYDPVSRVREARVSLAPPVDGDLIFEDGFESGDTSAWMAPPGPTSGTQSFVHDPFGNLIEIQGTPGRSIPVSPQTNRVIGADYDAAGNMTSWSGNSYSYGPFHETWRVATSNQEWIHLYDADDERVMSYQVGGAQKNRWTLRDLDNQVLREFVYDRPTGTGVVERDNLYRGVGGPLLLSASKTDEVHYHVDHLGTPRQLTDFEGNQIAFHTYFPFGEEATSPTQNLVRYKFTGHERDLADPTSVADDLDHMHARMTNPQLGRFLSVDPVGGSPRAPQSWNRYAYVRSNPLNRIDPDGRADKGSGFEKDIQTPCGNVACPPSDPIGRTLNTVMMAAFGGPLVSVAAQALTSAYLAAKGLVLSNPVAATTSAVAIADGATGGVTGIANAIPARLARVVPGDVIPRTLGRIGSAEVFVTAADDITGRNAAQLAERLTIQPSSSFTVFEFSTPVQGLASPIFRTDPGFVGGGRTAGGAREFVLPNGPIPADALRYVVGP